ncbi:hypothetical protein M9H77_24394 [Catharanthus roseus]|uniref:Uncharacterized protein n=1 Tax=Catharanthus roseus TaxID=4058 RepID=A0ACC0B004_CATRO|nr:hypothetical protein M9H77_24394 [Catharanthus roseus]
MFEKMLQRVPFYYSQRRTLVNVKLKWVKDPVLDTVAGGRELKAACVLISLIATDPTGCVPVYNLSRCRGMLGLSDDIKISTFMRKYPNIFEEFHVRDSGGTRVPWFRLSSEALEVYQEEIVAFQKCTIDILNRLKKLLMMCRNRMLPLQTIDQLKWDLSLPFDYENSMVKRHPEWFRMVRLDDGRDGLKLVQWDESLAFSHLEVNSSPATENKEALAFPIGFTRGFGLKKKCIKWLEEWQKLPYTSPYVDASHLDPRTDVSEKRIVGVFHELLHLTIQKKIERKNVSNLRKPLGLPQKFTKAFERHPGIFYISKKGDTQTVILRETYDRNQLIEKHPLVDIRERYATMMKQGFLDRSRGLYKKDKGEDLEEDESIASLVRERNRIQFTSEEDSEFNILSEYESDETN